MSASAATIPRLRWRDDLRLVRTLRYAVGCTLAMALALGIDWRLSYLTPVLTLSFLGSPKPRPGPGAMIGFMGMVTLTSGVGVAFSALLMPYPAMALLLVGLALYLLFYGAGRGVHPLLITLLLIAVTVIPVVGSMSMALAVAVGKGLIVGAAATLVVVWLAHGLLPDPGAQTGSDPAGAALPDRVEASRRAALNTIVLFPLVAAFLIFQLSSVLVLVFAALLSMQPDLSRGFAAGKALIVGNVMGGLGAILMYELLVMVPQFGFMLLLVLLAGLWLGGKLFSGARTAPLFGMAYSTMILVIGSTTSMYGDAGSKAWTRVIQITLAVAYLVVATGTLKLLRTKPEVAHATL